MFDGSDGDRFVDKPAGPGMTGGLPAPATSLKVRHATTTVPSQRLVDRRVVQFLTGLHLLTPQLPVPPTRAGAIWSSCTALGDLSIAGVAEPAGLCRYVHGDAAPQAVAGCCGLHGCVRHVAPRLKGLNTLHWVARRAASRPIWGDIYRAVTSNPVKRHSVSSRQRGRALACVQMTRDRTFSARRSGRCLRSTHHFAVTTRGNDECRGWPAHGLRGD